MSIAASKLLVFSNLILHIFLIIIIIIRCSGMFRNVPECSICLVLSTTFIARAARPNLGFHSGCPKGRPSLGFGRMSTFHAEFWTHHMVQATSMPCGHPAKHVCKILNNFLLLNRFLRLSSNENLLLLNFLSHFFHLVPCIWKF